MLKEQLEALIQENTILKRAVAVQHEHQKEYENQSQELQHLKQLASQYQEQLRNLEVSLMNSTFDSHGKLEHMHRVFICIYYPCVYSRLIMTKFMALIVPVSDESCLII